MCWRTKQMVWRKKPLSWRTRRQIVAHLILLLAYNTTGVVNLMRVVAHKTISRGASNTPLGKFNPTHGLPTKSHGALNLHSGKQEDCNGRQNQ